MVVSKSWYLTKRPTGEPKATDFTCMDEEIPSCGEGDVIVEAEYISVDPYVRLRIRAAPLDNVVLTSAISRIIESKNSEWPVGTYLMCRTGWRTHALVKKETLENQSYPNGCFRLPDLQGLPRSLGIGALGSTGTTAYFGFLEICKPQAGEVVLVSGAAGAVGSMVVQMAKLKGCTVIAFAGSDEKVSYLREIGADHAFNYKTTDVGEAIKTAAPRGIDCYFDNVGGQFSAAVLQHMAVYGRVTVCGAISTYNEQAIEGKQLRMNSPYTEITLVQKELTVRGFMVANWSHRWMEGVEQIKDWILQGKIKYRETVTEGFSNIPSAFVGLFSGENIGKAIVKV